MGWLKRLEGRKDDRALPGLREIRVSSVGANDPVRKEGNKVFHNSHGSWEQRTANMKRELEAIGVLKGDKIRVTDGYDEVGDYIFDRMDPVTGSLDFHKADGSARGLQEGYVLSIEKLATPEAEAPVAGPVQP